MFTHLIHYLESHMAPCYYKQVLGIPCPGCGMQTAFIELLKGHIWESITIYPALIPTIAMLFFLILHLIFRFRKGADILKYLFMADIAIVVFHYIYVLITLKH